MDDHSHEPGHWTAEPEVMEVRAVLASAGGGLTRARQKGIFWGDRNILHLDWDVGFKFVKTNQTEHSGSEHYITSRVSQNILCFILGDVKVKTRKRIHYKMRAG
jgi:hypothetical protein